jgi:hypothetical protein
VESSTGLASNNNAIVLCKKLSPPRYRTAWEFIFINTGKTESLMLSSNGEAVSNAALPTLRHAYHDSSTHDVIQESVVEVPLYTGAEMNGSKLIADFDDMQNGYPVVYMYSKGSTNTTEVVLREIIKNAGAGWTVNVI